MEIESQVIETAAGPYTVRWLVDESADQPYDDGFGLAKIGSNRYIEVTHGKDADEIASLIRYHRRANAYDGNIYDGEVRSAAAIARYVRLKFGVVGVLELDDRFNTSVPSADRGESFDGLAWTTVEAGATDPGEATRIGAQEWNAWAEGDVFGWVVEDPSGREVESCWGFYGFDREYDYTLSEAKDAAEYDAARRVDRANLVGAGIVGLI